MTVLHLTCWSYSVHIWRHGDRDEDTVHADLHEVHVGGNELLHQERDTIQEAAKLCRTLLLA